MKKTMSGRNIAKFHKMLAQEVPMKKISIFMGIEMKTLAKFVPEVQAEAVAAKSASVAEAVAAAEKKAPAEVVVVAEKVADKVEAAPVKEVAKSAKADKAAKG